MKNNIDLFISYATEDKTIAMDVVDRLEGKGVSCFIAPRDIETGKDYACEIVNAISNTAATLLVFSSNSNNSHFVLSEINSAVSRNKTIIPLMVEDFVPSEAMEFYLGPTHRLDAFPKVLDSHIDKVIDTLEPFLSINNKNNKKESKDYVITGPSLIKLEDASKIGLSFKDITMKEIEIDYLNIPPSKYNMNEDINGTVEDWFGAAENYENDTSILLVKNDQIIGYCDVYPVEKKSFEQLINGEVIIRDYMIDVFCVGGTFDIYVAMCAIIPDEANQNNYLMVLDWLIEKLDAWRNEDIYVNDIGISVYSDLLEKFVIKLGFTFASINPAKGKVYKTNIENFKNNPLVLKRHPHFYR